MTPRSFSGNCTALLSKDLHPQDAFKRLPQPPASLSSWRCASPLFWRHLGIQPSNQRACLLGSRVGELRDSHLHLRLVLHKKCTHLPQRFSCTRGESLIFKILRMDSSKDFCNLILLLDQSALDWAPCGT